MLLELIYLLLVFTSHRYMPGLKFLNSYVTSEFQMELFFIIFLPKRIYTEPFLNGNGFIPERFRSELVKFEK